MRPEVTEALLKLEAAIRVNERESLPGFTVNASIADIVELVLAFHALGVFQVDGYNTPVKSDHRAS
jgi:hypothetical protein